MRETPDAGRKRIHLSVAQVAGSALAAVVAAGLASYFGVYGTILGAGVVSVVATCGGTLFQHFFKRTGEQLREATAAARPREQVRSAPGEFTEGTVYRVRVKSRRRPVLAAAVVFGGGRWPHHDVRTGVRQQPQRRHGHDGRRRGDRTRLVLLRHVPPSRQVRRGTGPFGRCVPRVRARSR